MTSKIPCPQCGEMNYASQPACWACGASLKGPGRVAPAAPAEAPASTAPSAPYTPTATPPIEGKITCPHCGKPTFAGFKECHVCGGPLNIAPAAPAPPPTLPASPAPPSDGVVPAPNAENPAPGRKPAEIEAAMLREKEYVTPPVDVDDTPHGIGEWFAYIFQAIGASGQGLKEALDEYDRRRGRKSGKMSSYSMLIMSVLSAIGIIVVVVVVSFLAAHR